VAILFASLYRRRHTQMTPTASPSTPVVDSSLPGTMTGPLPGNGQVGATSAHNAAPSQPDDYPSLAQRLVFSIGRIHEMSQRLFPGPVSLEYAFDPEDPANEYIVFDVVAKGAYKDYRETIFQWHDEVREIVPGALSEFRLVVMPIR